MKKEEKCYKNEGAKIKSVGLLLFSIEFPLQYANRRNHLCRLLSSHMLD